MNIIAINGSPRKRKNTATVLQHALDGAQSVSGTAVTTELVQLYDLTFSPCLSCFECKKIGGKQYGHCALNDDLTALLQKIESADGIIFGSPIYFGDLSGNMISFMERLLFPFFTYDVGYPTIAPKRLETAFIYTMNVTKEMMETYNYQNRFATRESFVEKVFKKPQVLYVNNTYQFSDSSTYLSTCFSESYKRTST